jgi:acetyltransferase-like isoleucine patch superfamily enzyme
MSISRSIKMGLRPLIIPILRILKYYSLQTYYVEGDGGSLYSHETARLSNTVFNIESGNIFIGENTIFGYNSMVLTGTHQYKAGKRLSVHMAEKNEKVNLGSEVPRSGQDIKIGKNCWIASGVIIIGKVQIGDSVIIASGSVVSKDIPSNTIAGGVPAKPIRANL